MSKEIKQFNLGGTILEATGLEVTRRERIDDPEKPGKKKMREYKETIVVPAFTASVSAAAMLFGALLNTAEAREPGLGVKLAESYLLDRLDDAFEAAFDLTTGDFNEEKWTQLMTSPERPRSSGQSWDAINSEIGELAPELIALTTAATSPEPEAWRTIVDANGNQTFKSEDAFAVRLAEVLTRVQTLNTLREAKQKDNAERKAKKEENRLKAAEAAKNAAATAATN